MNQIADFHDRSAVGTDAALVIAQPTRFRLRGPVYSGQSMPLRSALFFGFLSSALLGGSSAVAGNLPFPEEGDAAKQTILADCPSCFAAGVTLCGTADVRFGRHFAESFFAGTPRRGYLPGFRLSGEEFRALARSLSPDALVPSLRQSFESLPLIVIDDGFAETRVLAASTAVEIEFPAKLHQCVRDASKPWGCCVAADCRKECCEKELGSPRVALSWDDPATGDKLTFHFSHTLGASTLLRTTAAGKTYIYWCNTGEPGWVQ
jgi:hypothetical protein